MRTILLVAIILANASAPAQNFFDEQRIIEDAETNSPVVVIAADVDGDGDLDVIAGSENDNRISWYANDGVGNFGPMHLVTSAVLELTWVDAADMDGDGDIDLLAFSWGNHALFWFANDGAGIFSAPVMIETMAYGMDHIVAADGWRW
ncbi:MAG: VCBS repeat-containing protein [Flavobacteriales bacterium]|nr:VCBS repeat-containing protein [Flavobacteriales bacterium]